MESAQRCITVADPSQIGEVRRAAARMAQALPLSASRGADAAIVATELATNLLRHAREGRVLLRGHVAGPHGWLELLSIDTGPGMAELGRCLQDGYSTAGTAGNGLGAIRRLSDAFDVHTSLGKGTVVLARIASAAIQQTAFTVGAVCLPAPSEEVCGDTWRIVEQDNELSVMLADGLGHGPEAAAAASIASQAFAEQAFTPPLQFYEHAHRSMLGSRGAAVARAVVRRAGDVEYSGIGNIAGSLVGTDRSRGLPSQNGTVGVEIGRRVASYTYPFPDPGVLMMHSDGITGRWSFDPYPGLLLRHPAVIAGVVSRDFRRGRDDATVVVASRHRTWGARG